jgi:hypothetical protein
MQYPLSEDPTQEDFTAVFNRSPLTVEILSTPEQLLTTTGLQASMVVLLGTGLPTTLTTAVAMGGAKTVKVFDDLDSASEYAAKTYRHPMQRIIGGEPGPDTQVSASTHTSSPLTRRLRAAFALDRSSTRCCLPSATSQQHNKRAPLHPASHVAI